MKKLLWLVIILGIGVLLFKGYLFLKPDTNDEFVDYDHQLKQELELQKKLNQELQDQLNMSNNELSELEKQQQEELKRLQNEKYINEIKSKINNYNDEYEYRIRIKKGKWINANIKDFVVIYIYEIDFDWSNISTEVTNKTIKFNGANRDNLYLKPISLKAYSLDFIDANSGWLQKDKEIKLTESEIKMLLQDAEDFVTKDINNNETIMIRALEDNVRRIENEYLKNGYNEVLCE